MFFKSRNGAPADIAVLRQDVSEALSKLLDEEEKVFGRHLVLRPSVSQSSEDSVGWFGGAPMLPAGIGWPSIDGEDLIFLAQIDMSKLPASAWRGAGPRDGYLVFFIHPRNIKARVLHVTGSLIEKTGRSPFESQFLIDIEDMRPRREPSCIQDQRLFPKWPVALESGLPSQPVRTSMTVAKGDDPNHPNPYPYPNSFSLSNRALHPFDATTLAVLMQELTSVFSGRTAKIENFLREKKLATTTRESLEYMKKETLETEELFSAHVARLKPFLENFDHQAVSSILEEVGELPFGVIDYRGDDPFGYAVIHVALGDSSNRVKFKWTGWKYPKALRKRARYAFVDDPDGLPAKLKERLVKEFKFLAAYEFGAMSHVPDRDVGMSYDPMSGDEVPLLDGSNEVLLELPTSELVGWMFGDMESLVFLMSRDDLIAENFNAVFTTVTN